MKIAKLMFLSLLLVLFATNIQAQERLIKSVKVPNIKLNDVRGKSINLQSMTKGNQKVLICFFRPVWCPICNHRTHELIQRYDELKKKGIEVIAIYPSNQETMAQYVKDANIPFTVISDPDELLYKQYAIERSMQKVMAAVERDDIKNIYVKGQELYKGKVYTPDTEKYETIINADFVVGGKRILEVAYYGEYVGDHYSLDELK